MLLNVVIADDEYFIRRRLIKIIPWQKLSFLFAGEASNGAEVLEYLHTVPVDILLLDIKMPKMDGLEVCEYIYHHYPDTKVIILSGYNDFEFARTTLRYRAMDYLLKPIDQEVLAASLSQCRAQILLERKERMQLEQYRHFEKCSVLTDVMNRVLTWDDYCSAYPDARYTQSCLYTGLYQDTDSSETIQDLKEAVCRAGIECEYFKELDYIYVLQVFFQDGAQEERFYSLLPDYLSHRSCYLFFSVGIPVPIGEDWSGPYRNILRMLNYRYFYDSSVILYEKELPVPGKPIIDLSRTRDRLLYYLNGKDETGFMDYLASLFDEILLTKDPSMPSLIVTECFVTLGIHFDSADSPYNDIREYVSQLLDEDYRLDNVKNAVISAALQCISRREPAPSDISLSKKIISYITENYSDPELTVATVAEQFNLNASYISSLFKKTNHISLLQYITKIRLEHSRQLLTENRYKITEIAEMVGYSDVFYFSKRFKRAYGCPPKDYRL